MSQINYVPFTIADKAKQPRFIQNKAGNDKYVING